MSGTRVITLDAYRLGEVNGVYTNTNSWKITNLAVRLTTKTTKELGLKKT